MKHVHKELDPRMEGAFRQAPDTRTKIGDPPCNGCTACCKRELVVLHPEDGDDIASYKHIMIDLNGKQTPVLERQEDGSCIYLTKEGCSIHGRAPVVCKTFDCRLMWFFLAKGTTRKQRQLLLKQGIAERDVWKAARLRMHTLKATLKELYTANVYWAKSPRKIEIPVTKG